MDSPSHALWKETYSVGLDRGGGGDRPLSLKDGGSGGTAGSRSAQREKQAEHPPLPSTGLGTVPYLLSSHWP
jgi:hypothetical protein